MECSLAVYAPSLVKNCLALPAHTQLTAFAGGNKLTTMVYRFQHMLEHELSQLLLKLTMDALSTTVARPVKQHCCLVVRDDLSQLRYHSTWGCHVVAQGM